MGKLFRSCFFNDDASGFSGHPNLIDYILLVEYNGVVRIWAYSHLGRAQAGKAWV